MQHSIQRWLPIGLLLVGGLVVALGYLGYRGLRDGDIVRRMPRRPLRVSADADAVRAERAVVDDPDDLVTRENLIAYYTGQPKFEEKREQHVLWMVAHHPECACSALGTEVLTLDMPHYAEVKALWLRQVDSHSGNVAVLANAASALELEPQLSRELANRGLAIKPDDPQSRRAVAQSYTQEMRFADSIEKRRSAAAKALEAWEEYAKAEPDDHERQQKLREFAISAFEAGDKVKAKQYATKMLDIQEKSPGPYGPDGDDIHAGNTVLGRLALQEGKIVEAKQRLLASAPEQGSAILNSYGPRMSLAAELLARGERKTVIAYFEKCRRFWHLGKEKIPLWESEIKAGKKPRFGENLRP